MLSGAFEWTIWIIFSYFYCNFVQKLFYVFETNAYFEHEKLAFSFVVDLFREILLLLNRKRGKF